MDYLELHQQNTFRLRKDLTPTEQISFVNLLFDVVNPKFAKNLSQGLPSNPEPGTFFAYVPIGYLSRDERKDTIVNLRIFNELYNDREVFYVEDTEESDASTIHVQVAFLSRAIDNPLYRPQMYADDDYGDDDEYPVFNAEVVFPAFQPELSYDARDHEFSFESLFSTSHSFNTHVVFVFTEQEAHSFSPYIDPSLTPKPFLSANVTGIPQL